MTEMVQIRSVKQYFNEFIAEPLKDKPKVDQVDLVEIKSKILAAFKNELFGQIKFKYGDSVKGMSTDDLASLDGVNNILTQLFRKWRRLCILCGEFGLGSFFKLEDLKDILQSQDTVVLPNPEEDVTGEVPEGTVIVDENTLEPVGEVKNEMHQDTDS